MYKHITGPSSNMSLDFSACVASQLTRLHNQELFGSELCSEAGSCKPSFSIARSTKFRQVSGHFFLNPILFAVCTSTFSKLCVTYTLTCRRELAGW
jgi:hypothetical protein